MIQADIEEYKLLNSSTALNMTTNVTTYLKQGWNLWGPGYCNTSGVHFQAMVKYKKITMDNLLNE